MSARAEVVKLTVEQRQPFQNAHQPYEKLTGRFFGELDPKQALNAVITDIALAPRNARGMVEYSATFTILKPVDMARESREMWQGLETFWRAEAAFMKLGSVESDRRGETPGAGTVT
jgi:hypothetical protein